MPHFSGYNKRQSLMSFVVKKKEKKKLHWSNQDETENKQLSKVKMSNMNTS